MQRFFLMSALGVMTATVICSSVLYGHQGSLSRGKTIGILKGMEDDSKQSQKFDDMSGASQEGDRGAPNLPQEDEVMIPVPQLDELDDPVSIEPSSPTQGMSMPVIITPQAEEVTWTPDDDPEAPPMPDEPEDPDDPTSIGDRKGGRHKGIKVHQGSSALQSIPIIRMGQDTPDQNGFRIIRGMQGAGGR